MRPFAEIACVSIAVPKIADALPAYVTGLGLEVTHDVQTSQRGFGMRWIQLGHGGRTFLELLEPTGEDGPVAAFLAKESVSKVYQVRFAVDDLDGTLETLRSRGMRVILGKDVPGQQRVGWVHPSSTGGVLFELLETKVPQSY